MTRHFDPELDLRIARVIKAPRAIVWQAWTERALFEQWWVPAPSRCQVVDMDLSPGGAFVTRISEDGGTFQPHLDACFLTVDDRRRIVFTNALTRGWRPAEQPFITAIVDFADHPDGTDYTAHVMHKSDADRALHEKMGFHDGWGTVTGQPAALVEKQA